VLGQRDGGFVPCFARPCPLRARAHPHGERAARMVRRTSVADPSVSAARRTFCRRRESLSGTRPQLHGRTSRAREVEKHKR